MSDSSLGSLEASFEKRSPAGHTTAPVEAQSQPTVLVVDDEALIRRSLRERLVADGLQVVEAEDGKRALSEFERGVDLVLLDYVLPDSDGVALLKKMKAIDPDPPIVLLTAHSSISRAVTAMREGAYHFATKPFELDEIAALTQRALEASRFGKDARMMLARERAEHGVNHIIGESPEMKVVKDLVRTVAQSRATTVLLGGESGVGKDMVARAIHAHSARAAAPFVNITCSALPDTLLESELFGHERGAFTDARRQKLGLLEQADGGTVFLDEIGEMSPVLQAKLLRFLEERAFRRVGGSVDIRPDVRVIAATNRDLAGAVQRGEFREDLFYRVAVARIDIPPLRARPSDVQLLTDYFVALFSRDIGKKVQRVDASARDVLRSYYWPGNVRELKNTLERAMLFCSGDALTAVDLQLISAAPAHPNRVRLPAEGIDLRALEKDLLTQALERVNWNHTRAATLLGLNRDQVRYRIAKFTLSPGQPKPE